MTVPANILSFSNVVNISAAQTPAGAGNFNKSNLALFTRDVPTGSFNSTLGYGIYYTAAAVGVDWGTTSYTYLMALSIFSQQPNILLPGGALVVIPFLTGTTPVEDATASGTAASGTIMFTYAGTYGGTTPAINWNDTAAVIQTKINTIEALRNATVTGTINAGLVITMTGVNGATATWGTTGGTLETSGSVSVTISFSVGTAGVVGETQAAILARTAGTVQYFASMSVEYVAETPLLAAAAVVQANQTQAALQFAVSTVTADIAPAGSFDLIRTGTFTQTRCLFYDGNTLLSALQYMASYASVLMSVNFTGTNTTNIMNLQNFSGVAIDPNITQTIQTEASTAGADCYVSIQGVPAVLASGANGFADAVYNTLAFSADLLIAYFNVLAQAKTKIAQTEDGMNSIKAGLRAVCTQYVTNQFLAPGQWNSSITFGNQALFLSNISNKGYYIYSSPISQQTQANRQARIAPFIQIAAKEAGGIQTGSVIVYLNP